MVFTIYYAGVIMNSQGMKLSIQKRVIGIYRK